MKKMFTILLILSLMCSSVIALQGDSKEQRQDNVLTNSEAEFEELDKSTDNEKIKTGEAKPIKAQENIETKATAIVKAQVKAQNKEEVKAMVQAKEQELEQNLAGKSEKEQNVLKNQNQVRTAVHALLAMEDMVGGIGTQVREIARNFNNSVQATINAEQKIQERGAFARFFAGGDAKAAEELETEVESNKEKLQLLKELKDQSNSTPDTKELLQEQIQNMEQEQNRLEELAQKEKNSKGLFGWLWK